MATRLFNKADLVNGTVPTAQLPAYLFDLTTSGAVRRLAGGTSAYYTGSGTAAAPNAEAVRVALAASAYGDTVVALQRLSPYQVVSGVDSVTLPSGVSFDTGGFDIDATAGYNAQGRLADGGKSGITTGSGNITVQGKGATVTVSGQNAYGVGMASLTASANLNLYDLHISLNKATSTTALYGLYLGIGNHYHTGNIAGSGCVAIYAKGTAAYNGSFLVNTGSIKLDSPGQVFNLDSYATVTHTGNITTSAPSVSLGYASVSSRVNLYEGTIRLYPTSGNNGTLKLDSTSQLSLYNVTVIGAFPAEAAVAGQAAGATVNLYGSTTLPPGAYPAGITVNDYRQLPIASAASAGVVKVGSGLTVAADGTLAATAQPASGPVNTDALPEGSTNLYYTSARSAAKADLVSGKVPIAQLPTTLADKQYVDPKVSADIKAAVSGPNEWPYGELSGTQPAGSLRNMKFVDASYRYEFMPSMNDTDETQLVWVRSIKG